MLKSSKEKNVGVGLTRTEEAFVLRLAKENGVSKANMLKKIHEDIINSNFVDTLDVKEVPENSYFRTHENLANKLTIQCRKLKRSVSSVFRRYLATLEE